MKIKKMKVTIKKLIILGIITIIAFVGCSENRRKDIEGNIKGEEYLRNLEQMDLVKVEEKIEEHHKQINLEAIESGDFKAIYADTIFMGDSIMESLSFNDILREDQVIAYMGDTVRKAVNHINILKGIQPRNVVLLYGMNDVILFEETAQWNTIDRFKEEYKLLIEELKNSLPNTNIYVQSPLPVTKVATATNPRLTNENLTRFRAVVKEVCEETDVTYVDINILAGEDSGLHEADGIHFKKEFYENWLGYLRGFMNK